MQISRDSRPYYERIGGEDGLRRLVQRFYQLMDSMPETKGIRDMHEDLPQAEEKLFMFLSGWMGGPQLYREKYGHPRLRMRHMPFSIGNDESRQWMLCMARALDESVEDESLREELKETFYKIADFMRNQAD